MIQDDSLLRLDIDTDGFKALLGYVGPYYNTSKLDGRVDVLGESVYVWPGERWQATGMVRNQTCQNVHIINLTARLLGRDGELLDNISATVPVDELRPGEPVPFSIEASIHRSDVIALVWHVDYALSKNTPSRSFTFAVYEEEQVLGGSRYSLYGSIRNGPSISTSAHIVAAWLNDQGRVVYVESPKVRLAADPSQLKGVFDLAPGDFEDFTYTSDDPSLITLLSKAHVALWGISN